ncbi:hypothetical protein V8J88_01010 [Massilia sp. W12]|uniref:hypothetical protein n=1 Tax=Massilia sp. W12 TaxID=3126507 RepID=UPI0030CC0FF2
MKKNEIDEVRSIEEAHARLKNMEGKIMHELNFLLMQVRTEQYAEEVKQVTLKQK